MPTSSQSQILSVVDYQSLQQQQASGQDGTTAKLSSGISVNQTSTIGRRRSQSKDERRPSIGRIDESAPPANLLSYRRNSTKINDGTSTSRTQQRNEVLHIPIINLNTTDNNKSRLSIGSLEYRRNSFNNNNQMETEYRSNQLKINPTPLGNNSSLSDLENLNDDDEDDDENHERRKTLLNEYGRRLLVLGTIRPSKTFYKDLPESDVEYLMGYFRQMRNTNRKLTSEEINQELKTKLIEYQPKICKLRNYYLKTKNFFFL